VAITTILQRHIDNLRQGQLHSENVSRKIDFENFFATKNATMNQNKLHTTNDTNVGVDINLRLRTLRNSFRPSGDKHTSMPRPKRIFQSPKPLTPKHAE